MKRKYDLDREQYKAEEISTCSDCLPAFIQIDSLSNKKVSGMGKASKNSVQQEM